MRPIKGVDFMQAEITLNRVAIYVRVSTVEQAQEGYSIPAQIALLKKYAQTYGYVITKIYQDAGISGKNIQDRPGLLQMLEDAKQHKFDVILIWKLSRLSRSLLDMLGVVDLLQQNNVSLLSYSEHFDTSTPIGKMLLQLLGSIAEFERNTIIENVKMGMNQRFKEGLSKSSIPFAYSYSDSNKEVLVDSKKAETVREIFRRYAAGANIQQLTDYINGLGYTNRLGRKWRHEMLVKMLSNEFYNGYVTTGRKDLKNGGFEAKKGIHEAIIDDELFAAVQQRLEANKQKAPVRKKDADQLFSSVVKCPKCGLGMYYIESHSTRNGKKYPACMYRCGGANPNRGLCTGFCISTRKVDPPVLKKLEVLINSEVVENIAALAEKANKPDHQAAIRGMENEIQEAAKARDRYFALFETGKVEMDAFADRINELMKKINRLQKQREELEKQNTLSVIDFSSVIEGVKSFMSLYDDLHPQERRDIIRELIEKVYVSESKKVHRIRFVGGFELEM